MTHDGEYCVNILGPDNGVCRTDSAIPGLLNLQDQLQPTHIIGSPVPFKELVINDVFFLAIFYLRPHVVRRKVPKHQLFNIVHFLSRKVF